MKCISSWILLSLVTVICNAGQLDLYATSIDRLQDRFTIKTSNQLIEIPNYQVSRPIRDLTPEKLAAVLNSGSHYLRANQLSDGSYALDMQGRLPGEGIAGAIIGGFVGYVAVPALIVIPTATALYAAKAAVHIRCGAAAGDAFQKTVIDNTMPKVCEVAHRAAQVSSPTATVIGSFFTGPV